jgi:hypothetical protein
VAPGKGRRRGGQAAPGRAHQKWREVAEKVADSGGRAPTTRGSTSIRRKEIKWKKEGAERVIGEPGADMGRKRRRFACVRDNLNLDQIWWTNGSVWPKTRTKTEMGRPVGWGYLSARTRSDWACSFGLGHWRCPNDSYRNRRNSPQAHAIQLNYHVLSFLGTTPKYTLEYDDAWFSIYVTI